MQQLVWDEKMAIGNDVVDAQHQELVRNLNELIAAMRSGKGKQTIGKILHFLCRYTEKHFATEERLMAKNGYPAFEEHREQHRRFVRELESMRERYEASATQLAITVRTQRHLMDWLRGHILGTDSRMGGWLRETAAT